MKQRGRKSKMLNVIEGDFGAQRPDPPEDIPDRAKTIWIEIARDEPPDYFGTAATRNMLQDLCLDRAEAEKVTEHLRRFKTGRLKTDAGLISYTRLIKVRGELIRNAANLATKLRLTNQARYTPRAAASASHNTAKGLKPWEL